MRDLHYVQLVTVREDGSAVMYTAQCSKEIRDALYREMRLSGAVITEGTTDAAGLNALGDLGEQVTVAVEHG